MGGSPEAPKDYGIGNMPVSREVHRGASTPSRILNFIASLRHPDGAINIEAESIKEVMERAEEKDLDVILVPQAMSITTVSGKWLVDHKKHIEIGAGVVLTAALAAGLAGVILRKHYRDSSENK